MESFDIVFCVHIVTANKKKYWALEKKNNQKLYSEYIGDDFDTSDNSN